MRMAVAVVVVVLSTALAGCEGSSAPPAAVKHMPDASDFGTTIDETLILDTVLDGNRVLEKDVTFPPEHNERFLRVECLGKGMTWIDVRLRGGGGESSISFNCSENPGVNHVDLKDDALYTDPDGRAKITVHASGKEIIKQSEADDYEDESERFDPAPARSSYAIKLSYAS